MNLIESRKDEHIKISIEKNVSADYNYWDDIRLIHNALPEINKDEIDLKSKLFNKYVKRLFKIKNNELYFFRFYNILKKSK